MSTDFKTLLNETFPFYLFKNIDNKELIKELTKFILSKVNNGTIICKSQDIVCWSIQVCYNNVIAYGDSVFDILLSEDRGIIQISIDNVLIDKNEWVLPTSYTQLTEDDSLMFKGDYYYKNSYIINLIDDV